MQPARIPGDTTNISDTWADHRARLSLGGTDFTDSAGTVMRAMNAGTVIAVDNSPGGSGGRMVTIRCNDGSLDLYEELHALSITILRGAVVAIGDQLGISAGSGFGEDFYYGAHIHVHGIHSNGVRFNLEPYIPAINGGTNPAGLPAAQPEEKQELAMFNLINGVDSKIIWATGPFRVGVQSQHDLEVLTRFRDALRKDERIDMYYGDQKRLDYYLGKMYGTPLTLEQLQKEFDEHDEFTQADFDEVKKLLTGKPAAFVDGVQVSG